ncbi:Mediator of RNA polymerase II transcription subunit 18 [Choanephora cucurbitarum]|uniref:Mediator of RNA polymerase II transcription subunit 18 n=1 Tax=Choanephora cucurbitarum TaxID=101091 RepID=A0A1C7NKL9_9FUNG|nr:Mediator of RNA polymerase II transcription subunit 18 [Choanephora cucurbitarum]
MSNYECSLQGVVVGHEQKEKLIQRLIGLCGNDAMSDLFEHELVFIPSTQTPIGPARNDDVVLRLQSRINNQKEMSIKYRQWYLCMQGNPEPQRQRTVTVRPISRVQLSGDIFRYMKSLGYSFSFDVVKKGHLLAYDKIIKVTVFQLYKLKKINVETAVHIGQEDMWIIEVTTAPVLQEQVNQMAEHLNKFKNLMIGIVDLEHVDIRALQNKIHYTN